MKNYVLLILLLVSCHFRAYAIDRIEVAADPSIQEAQDDNDFKFCELKDKTGFDARYNNLSYHYFLPKGFKQGEITWNLFIEKYLHYDSIGSIIEYKYTDKGPSVRKNRNLVKFRLLNQDRRWGKKRSFLSFDVYNSNYEYTNLINLFPELVAFKNYNFELDEHISNRDFFRNYKRGKIYNNVKILYEKGDELGTIELKTDKAFIRLDFKVIHTSKSGKKRTDSRFVRAFERYQIYMTRKKVVFDNYVNLHWKGNSVDRDTYFYKIKVLKFKKIDLGVNIINTNKRPIEVMKQSFNGLQKERIPDPTLPIIQIHKSQLYLPKSKLTLSA